MKPLTKKTTKKVKPVNVVETKQVTEKIKETKTAAEKMLEKLNKK